jgi:hypothetical protein
VNDQPIRRQTSTDLIDWALRNPNHPTMRVFGQRQTWHKWEASMPFHAGVAPAAPSVAHLMEQAGDRLTEPDLLFLAQPGAVLFFDVPHEYGHAAIALTDGAGAALFAGPGGLRALDPLAYHRKLIGWADFQEED